MERGLRRLVQQIIHYEIVYIELCSHHVEEHSYSSQCHVFSSFILRSTSKLPALLSSNIPEGYQLRHQKAPINYNRWQGHLARKARQLRAVDHGILFQTKQ